MRTYPRRSRSWARLRRLYLVNATLLVAHEVDSAYWREWTLFHIPGGIQAFVVLNLVLIGVVLYGLQAVTLERASGIAFSWLVAAGGLFAVVVHSWFLVQGNPAFREPVSLVLLALVLVLSLSQAATLMNSHPPTR